VVLAERQETAMAIAIDIVTTMTVEQYDEQLTLMGLKPFGTDVPGVYFHWAAVRDDGKLRIVEVWESQEQFEIYFGTSIGPALAEMGFSDMPEITFYEVHNYLTPPGYPASVSALPAMWTTLAPVPVDD
jgi:hypothetical protein